MRRASATTATRSPGRGDAERPEPARIGCGRPAPEDGDGGLNQCAPAGWERVRARTRSASRAGRRLLA